MNPKQEAQNKERILLASDKYKSILSYKTYSTIMDIYIDRIKKQGSVIEINQKL